MNEPDDLSHYMSACSRLRAENARLQEREAELEELLFADHEVDEALAARVIKAEARDKLRREALKTFHDAAASVDVEGVDVLPCDSHPGHRDRCWWWEHLRLARAAIDISPEEAKEK